MIAPDGARVYFTCFASGALFVNRHVVLEGKLPNRALPEFLSGDNNNMLWDGRVYLVRLENV